MSLLKGKDHFNALMLTLVRHRGRSHWGSLSARSAGGLVSQGGGNFDSQMANKILTWDQLMIKLVHKRLFLFQWNLHQFGPNFKFNDHKHPCSENWPKKINSTMKVISSCIAFLVGIGRRLCCYEALVIGDQTWFALRELHSYTL